ncbi:hypothetical protein JCM11957_04850 [Caminibacter profundus]
MDLKEIEKLKDTLFENIDEEQFLKKITKELLNSKIKEETISPLILTHQEFIDVSLKRIIKKIKQNLVTLAEKRNRPVFDKIFDIKLDYLAAYLFKKDIAGKKIIHKTIAKYILNIIKKNHILLNNFASTLNRTTIQTKYGKFKYPELYPYDRHKFASPIPLLKQEITKIDNIKKILDKLNKDYEKFSKSLEKKKILLTDIKLALKRIKTSILPILKKTKKENEYKEREFIFTMQKKRFEVLYFETEKEIKNLEVQVKSLKKNIEGFKEKNKDILNLEEKIIDTLAINLSKTKKKVN